MLSSWFGTLDYYYRIFIYFRFIFLGGIFKDNPCGTRYFPRNSGKHYKCRRGKCVRVREPMIRYQRCTDATTHHGDRVKLPYTTRISVNYPVILSLNYANKVPNQPYQATYSPKKNYTKQNIQSSSCLSFPGKLSFHPVKLWFLCIWINEYTRSVSSTWAVVPVKMVKRFTTLICFVQSVVCLLMWVLMLSLSLFVVMGLRFFCTI